MLSVSRSRRWGLHGGRQACCRLNHPAWSSDRFSVAGCISQGCFLIGQGGQSPRDRILGRQGRPQFRDLAYDHWLRSLKRLLADHGADGSTAGSAGNATWILLLGRRGLRMAVAGPYDTVGRARGFHSIREDESLSPRRLVTVLNWIAFSASSTLPQPHDVGDLTGLFLSRNGRRGERRLARRMHDLYATGR